MLGDDFGLRRAALVGVLLAALVLMLKQALGFRGLPSSEFLLLVPLWAAATLLLLALALARRLSVRWLLAREERRRLIRIAPRTDTARPAG